MNEPGQQRNFYRVRYPIAERPKLEIGGWQFEVLELSERGLRLSVFRGIWPSTPPERIEAEITLVSGKTRTISASFNRVEKKEHVYTGLSGIFPNDIVQEQRFLIRKYPSRGSPPGDLAKPEN